jgi:hypothetical protein
MSRKKNTFIIKRLLLGLKRDIKSDIDMLKRIHGVFNYQDLAIKLDISENAIKGWVKRKSIPQKYLNIIEDHRINAINDYVKENNIDIPSKEKIEKVREVMYLLMELDDKKIEYYYHLIKAETLKE